MKLLFLFGNPFIGGRPSRLWLVAAILTVHAAALGDTTILARLITMGSLGAHYSTVRSGVRIVGCVVGGRGAMAPENSDQQKIILLQVHNHLLSFESKCLY